MEEEKYYVLTEEEENIIIFYRGLSETKKTKFLKLISSLQKMLMEIKELN